MGDNRAERVKPIRGQESLVKERLQGGITTTKGLLVKSYAAVICKTDAVDLPETQTYTYVQRA